MANRSRDFQAFTQSIKLFVSDIEELAQAQIIQVVREEKDRVRAETRGRGTPYGPEMRQYVDGRQTTILSAVKPTSTVRLEWEYLAEAADFAAQRIRDASPDFKGNYDKLIAYFVGDNEERGDLNQISSSTRVITVGSTAIYSRRLEVGKKKGGTQPFVIEPADFEFVHKSIIAIRRRYGAVVDVTYSQFQLPATGDQTYPAARIRIIT